MVTWRSLLAFLKWPDERQTDAVPGAAQTAIARGARLSEVAAFARCVAAPWAAVA